MLIPCQRHLFDMPDDIAYLNCAAISPGFKSLKTAGDLGIDRKLHPWRHNIKDIFFEAEKLRTLAAELIHSSADDIAIVPSTSYAMSLAALNIPVKARQVLARQNLVLIAEDFPSNVYPWRAWAKKNDVTIKTVDVPVDHDWTKAVLSQIDANTVMVNVPQGHWVDGGFFDLVAVGEKTRSVGAALILDLTQSLGAVPFDVQKIQPDFMVASTYKWLFGPFPMGILYVAPKYHNGEPLEYSWITRDGAEDLTRLVDYTDAYQKGARRFDMGGRHHTMLMPYLNEALRQVLTWGVENIAQTVQALTNQIQERAVSLGLKVCDPSLRVAHIIGLRFPGGIPQGLMEELIRHQVYVSVRGDAIRVAPHVFNHAQDIDALFTVIKKFLR